MRHGMLPRFLWPLLLVACQSPAGTGALQAHLVLPPARAAAAPAPYRAAAYGTSRPLDAVRVSVLDGATVVAREEAPVAARSLDVLSLPEGTYTVKAEALVAGEPVLAGRAEGVVVVTGKTTDTGDIALAPITPAPPVVAGLPALTKQSRLEVRGTKEMFTGVRMNGMLIVGTDERTAFTAAVSLGEGANTLAFTAVNPDGVEGPAYTVGVTLDTQAPTGSITIAAGAALVTARSVNVTVTADGADEMRIGEQADLTGAAWVKLAPALSYTLAAGNGLKTLYAQFRDRAGNTSDVVNDSVTLELYVPPPPPPSPTLTGVTPRAAVNGTVVTFAGSTLGVTQGTSTVTLAGAPLTVIAWSDTQVQATISPLTPPGAGALVLTVGATPLAAGKLWVYPTITGRTPAAGSNGALFGITGANFGAAAATPGDGAYFGAASAASISLWSPTSIQGTTPFETPATLTTLTVVAGGLASAVTDFTGTRPWIESRTPRVVSTSQILTLAGRNFGVSGTVEFNGTLASTIQWTPTQIQVMTPSAQPAGHATVRVTTVGGVSNMVDVLVRGSGVWVPLGDRPAARGSVTAVWTGTEMLVWGGDRYTSNANPGYVSGTGHRFNPATGSWLPMNPVGAPGGRSHHSAVWTGKEMIVYGGSSPGTFFEATGGRYNPLSDSWIPIPAGDPGRTSHKAVWSGTEMLVFSGDYTTSGGRYNPLLNAWAPMAAPAFLGDRSDYGAVWTGSEMLVWGGMSASLTYWNDGGRYDPRSDTWAPLPVTGAPSARRNFSAVWTGREMIVWGGCCTFTNTGGVYDPANDTWRATSVVNAPSGRENHAAVWAGSAMIVLGGVIDATGGRYDPKTDTWVATPITGATSFEEGAMVWTGKEAIAWGGFDPADYAKARDTGLRYDPKINLLTPIAGPAAELPAARGEHAAVWTGSEMIVWGGYSGTLANTLFSSGGRYNPTTDAWLPTSTAGSVPSARKHPSMYWTGSEVVVWGGADLAGPLQDGGRYQPSTDSWVPMNNTFAPPARDEYAQAAAGTKLFIWGGVSGGTTYFNGGGVYDTAINDWNATSTSGSQPSGRKGSVAVWTGSKVLVWGGYNNMEGERNDGAAYDLALDQWTSISSVAAPTPRHGAYGVWNGSAMLVWGGAVTQTSGGRYYPAGDTWATMATIETSLLGAAVVAAGANVFTFGGTTTVDPMLKGFVYNAATDTWNYPNTIGYTPFARKNATAVWTGTEVILWGGYYDGSQRAWNDGVRYVP